jgi:O-antigen ligase
MQQAVSYNKPVLALCMACLLACIVTFCFTGSYVVFAVPLAIAYLFVFFYDWKAAYWILICCVPVSMQFMFMQRTGSLSFPDEPMCWLFLVYLVVMLAYKPNAIPKYFWYHPITIVVGLQFLWLLVAVFNSQVLFFSLKFLLAKVWYLACFFMLPLFVFRTKSDFKRGFLLVLAPMVATMIYITWQHYLLHFNFAKVNKAIGLLYYNHVEYSTVASMFLPLVCVAYPLSRGMKKSIRVLLLVLIAFYLVVVGIAYARAAVLAVVFAGLIALAIRYRFVNIIMPCFYALVIAGVMYMAKDNKYIDFRPDYQHTYMRHNFADHMVATFRGQDISSMERLYRWIAAVRMSADRPLTGYGPHGFYYFYKPYAVLTFRTYVSDNYEHSTTHNYFLFMLVEQGWPAMLLYALLVMVVFAQAQKIYHRFNDRFYKYCTLGIAMLFAACFVNNFFSELIETHKVGALFYLALALLVVLDRKSKEEIATA